MANDCSYSCMGLSWRHCRPHSLDCLAWLKTFLRFGIPRNPDRDNDRHMPMHTYTCSYICIWDCAKQLATTAAACCIAMHICRAIRGSSSTQAARRSCRYTVYTMVWKQTCFWKLSTPSHSPPCRISCCGCVSFSVGAPASACSGILSTHDDLPLGACPRTRRSIEEIEILAHELAKRSWARPRAQA